jgi:hypothetical protein
LKQKRSCGYGKAIIIERIMKKQNLKSCKGRNKHKDETARFKSKSSNDNLWNRAATIPSEGTMGMGRTRDWGQ